MRTNLLHAILAAWIGTVDIEEPEHAKQLLAQRKSAREQRLLTRFLGLSPRAQAYREDLRQNA